LVAVVVIPAGIASSLIMNNAVPPDLADQIDQLDTVNPVLDDQLLEDLLRFLGAAVVAGLIQAGAAVLASAGSVTAVAEIYLGGAPQWRDSLATAVRRIPAIFITGLLIIAALGALTGGVWLLVAATASTSAGGSAIAALSLIAWLVAIPWMTVSMAPAIPVLIIEGTSPAAAVARSFNLVRRRWWPTFGTLLTTSLIVAVLSGIASRILEAFIPGGSGVVSGTIVGVAISVATTPFVVAVLAVLYFDLRARREPFDLRRLASEVGYDDVQSASEPDTLPPGPPGPPGPPDRADWPPLPPEADQGEPPPVE
jgi:hypothetical protein